MLLRVHSGTAQVGRRCADAHECGHCGVGLHNALPAGSPLTMRMHACLLDSAYTSRGPSATSLRPAVRRHTEAARSLCPPTLLCEVAERTIVFLRKSPRTRHPIRSQRYT
jgi:hypothetical protein